jgi:uncharacterized phiE125 gp8 family phage protein
MPTILNTPPLLEPISLAETKAHLRVLHSDEDTTITRLIEAARRDVENRTGQILITQSWSQFFDGWPICGYLPLSLSPIISVIDVKIYGDDDVAAIVDPAHYYLDRRSRPARLTMRNGRWLPQPGRKLNGIEVVLNVGFGAAAAAVPQPLSEAMLLLVGHWYANRGDDAKVFEPLAIASLVEAYRRVRI